MKIHMDSSYTFLVFLESLGMNKGLLAQPPLGPWQVQESRL